ncbi:TrkH family potassium uptake protein [Acidimicrobiia bacterium EGI L10123]|uniref:TrkH family potassium uptake protein n=1 Tax=Salinilacustrithrix flava TaxID=2957203 RepID=UPI003D7C1CCE|nr:TrkH family potassium uptake protein [Acidimicrobiia bacterium EGI L10123]
MPTRRASWRTLRHPAQYVAVAFAGASLIGALLLRLPFATEPGETTSFVTALFTATSAVCVTGLVVVDTAGHWSTFGEVVILGLIQIGGFGIIALSSLLVAVLARRLGLRQRLIAVAETGALDMSDVRRLLVNVAKLTFVVEVLAAILLAGRFAITHGEPAHRAAYLGVFHSVSAFNNAGFALFSDSLIGYQRDSYILVVIAAAIIVGGLGLPVWSQIGTHRLRTHRWSLHAKLTVTTVVALILGGWALFAWFEWTNPDTLGQLSAWDSTINAFFHSVTPRTAGFNSVDIASLREPSRLLTEVLMFIGGGSASTAGGIKVTTFAVLGWVMWAEARGDPDVVVFERRIPQTAQRQALTVALLAIGVVISATMLLLATSALPRADLMFEVISALATVGLSANITPLLSVTSQLVIIVLMIIGRVGPITLFAALVLREHDRLYRHPEERPIIG